MTVAELIKILELMPESAEVQMHWDGEPRTDVEAVWLTQAGTVSIGWLTEPVYSDEGRTSSSPSMKISPYLAVDDMPDVIKGKVS